MLKVEICKLFYDLRNWEKWNSDHSSPGPRPGASDENSMQFIHNANVPNWKILKTVTGANLVCRFWVERGGSPRALQNTKKRMLHLFRHNSKRGSVVCHFLVKCGGHRTPSKTLKSGCFSYLWSVERGGVKIWIRFHIKWKVIQPPHKVAFFS